jgi:MerR family transcriptional regulator, copper efflux regulator
MVNRDLSMPALKIGSLARRGGVSVDTVRFYERNGLLPRAQRSASGYRQYDADAVDRLRFIRRAKSLGFSLEEIAQLLGLNDGKGSRAQVRALGERRLVQIEQAIADLERIRASLAMLVRQCSGQGTVTGCPIIEAVVGAGK